MSSSNGSVLLGLLVVVLVVGAVYLINPSLFSFLTAPTTKSGFANAPTMGADSNTMQAGPSDAPGAAQMAALAKNLQALNSGGSADASGNKQGFADMEDFAGPSDIENAQGPAGCYPRDQLTPSELLPKDPNSVWAQQNPMGQGSLKGKNFLSAGALIGVNTVGQSLRNANLQLRSEPPNPQVPVSVFYNSTIQPDTSHRDLEIN